MARRPDESGSKIFQAKLANKSLASKSIHWKSEDLIYADQSELKINNPNLQNVGRANTDFLTGSSQDKLSILNNEARRTNDPSINFSSNFGQTLENEAIYSRPELNLRSHINEIEIEKFSKV